MFFFDFSLYCNGGFHVLLSLLFNNSGYGIKLTIKRSFSSKSALLQSLFTYIVSQWRHWNLQTIWTRTTSRFLSSVDSAQLQLFPGYNTTDVCVLCIWYSSIRYRLQAHIVISKFVCSSSVAVEHMTDLFVKYEDPLLLRGKSVAFVIRKLWLSIYLDVKCTPLTHACTHANKHAFVPLVLRWLWVRITSAFYTQHNETQHSTHSVKEVVGSSSPRS